MPSFLYQDFKDIFNEICSHFWADDVKIPGMKLIGQGTTGKIWDIGNSFVFKVFYIGPQGSLPIPKQMEVEIITYAAVQKYTTDMSSPLPRIYSSQSFPEAQKQGQACGWAVLSKMPGKNLTFKEVEKLPDADRKNWISGFIDNVIRIEEALAKVPNPPEYWGQSYTASRFEQIRNNMPDVTKSELKTADAIEQIIKSTRTQKPRYLHGDLNARNILTDTVGVQILDPLVSHDLPEANWRFMPADLAKACAKEYEKRTGYQSNPKIMSAFVAATALFNYIRDKDGPDSHGHLERLNLNLLKLGL